MKAAAISLLGLTEEFYEKIRTVGFKRPYQRPAMSFWELYAFESILRTKKPNTVLEWGSGLSTFRCSRLLPPGATWRSIGHDKAWKNQSETLLAKTRRDVTITFIPPNNAGFKGDGTAKDFADYANLKGVPESENYDLILIDGRARVACIGHAQKRLAPNGVIIVHDANRPAYHQAIRDIGYHRFFLTDRKDMRGMAIASRDLSIDQIVDENFIQRLKRYHERADWLYSRCFSSPF